MLSAILGIAGEARLYLDGNTTRLLNVDELPKKQQFIAAREWIARAAIFGYTPGRFS